MKKLIIGKIREAQKSTFPDICSAEDIIPNIAPIAATAFQRLLSHIDFPGIVKQLIFMFDNENKSCSLLM